jgi:large subunit ribosomal protein L4
MLSELVRTDRLRVTDGIELEAPKTRLLVNQLKQWGLEKALIIVEAQDEKLYLAARNLPYVEVIEASGLNPLALAAHEHVLITRGAAKMLEERLQ